MPQWVERGKTLLYCDVAIDNIRNLSVSVLSVTSIYRSPPSSGYAEIKIVVAEENASLTEQRMMIY